MFRSIVIAGFLFLALSGCIPAKTEVFETRSDISVVSTAADRRNSYVKNSSKDTLICPEAPPDAATANVFTLGAKILDKVEINAGTAEEVIRLINNSNALNLLRTEATLLCVMLNFSKIEMSTQEALQLYSELVETTNSIALAEVLIAQQKTAESESEISKVKNELLATLLDQLKSGFIEISDQPTPPQGGPTTQSINPATKVYPTPILKLTNQEFLDLLNSLLNGQTEGLSPEILKELGINE